ncbi:Calcium-channel protein CCH1 [Candida viswanathii]|uniref:Calcium-channel protein CCH1 n=1 Tax=Candida viswanathii TaxID=5486 RepID=A0A367Y3S1_9ASCO|nr:Calcium-channel protein CCH1 [Candida viswanathii]
MSYSSNAPKRKRPGIVINPPTQSTLDVINLTDEDVSYDEDFDPNKTYTSNSQYWQRQTSVNRTQDAESVEIPAFPQVRDVLPERTLPRSDQRLHHGRDILNVLHLSRPSSPTRSSHDETPSTPNIGSALEEEDLEELKAGLHYALGTKEKEANWFPVNTPTKSHPSSKEHLPSADASFANYTNEIPMQDLPPKRPPLRTFNSQGSTPTLFISPFDLKPDNINEATLDPNRLETGSQLSVESKDGSASPRFASALARISDRIAGSGNARRKNESTDRLEVTESQTSLPLRTPVSEHFTFFGDTTKSPQKSVKTVPDVTVTDEFGQSSIKDTNGLGLYVKDTNRLRASTEAGVEPESPPEVSLLHQVKSSIKKEHKKSETQYQDLNTMYLFGNSLGIFSPQSKIRQMCYKVFEHNITNVVFLVILFLQVALLTYRQWNPPALGGYMYEGYNWADYILMVINIIYTFEIAGKIIAYGLYNDRVMFAELGMPYPESDLRKQYFNYGYLRRSLKFFKLDKVTNKMRKKPTKPPVERTHKQSLSEDSDIREINLNESSENLLHQEHNDSFNLRNKYNMHLHHGKYTPLSTDDSEESDDLNTTAPAPTGRLQSKNTFFKPTQNTFDTLNLKRAFLRSSWQRIDFISAVTFWISLFISADHYDAEHHITLFRAVSCFRILRLINLTTGTTTILKACKTAIPQLIDVSIFITCFWLFFGIIGVQTFKSSLTRHCVWTNPDDPTETYINEELFCGSYWGLDGEKMPYLMRDGLLSDVIKGYRCPKYSQCVSGDNPYNGSLSFDNILQSLEIVFVIMSANTFTDVMYYTMDTDNIAACLFFIGAIFVMTVWLLNVFIAIIVASFNITRLEVQEEKKKKRQGRRIFRVFGYADEELSMHEDRIEFLKKQNLFLKWYYKLEFIFVIFIIVDLFAQCFRRYDMDDFRRHTLYRIESTFTGIFVGEIIFRFAIYFPHWRMFFLSKRNCFDLFLAVITGIIILGPVKNALGQAYYWLTAFQLMRAYRVVLATSITRTLWLKIMGNFKALFDLTLFFFILLYLVSIIIARYYEGNVPEEDFDDVDFPMSTLPGVFIGLYVITSTENWTSILYAMQEYARTTSSRSFGAIFLISWFILSNMVILNIFIAVIAKTLEVSEEAKRKQQLFQFIDTMTNKLQHIEEDSGILAKIKKKIFRKKQVKDELEQAVVNLLLSGTAVNDFLDHDAQKEFEQDEEELRVLPSSAWKRWLSVNYWRTRSFFRNPFYGDHSSKRNIGSLENFNPANFARNIIKERKNIVTRQNEFLEANPRYNYVFYIIGPLHPLRRMCQRMVKPSYGERIDGVMPYKPLADAMVVFMFIATITLVVIACYMTPIYRSVDRGFDWTFWSEYIFVIIFSTEFAIKVFADGFIFTPNAYVRSSWNLIDLVVLISLWIEAIAYLKNDGNLSRIVRGLKALRALRLLTISETAKANFHNTMIAGFWKIINAAIISLCLLLPFSIWGLNIFNGRLGYCIDEESDMSSCFNEYHNDVFNWEVLSPNVYTNPQLHFNRFANSFATLFEIVSLEGWSDLLANVMASTGIGTPKETNASPFNGFFVVLFNFVSTVFILTLFVSVIISNYSISTGRAYMTTDQISWYQVKKILVQVRPSRRKKPENLNFFRRFCYRMTVEKNPIWTRALNFVLFFHVLALLMESFPSRDDVNTFRTVVYTVASSMFFVNSIMLAFGQGFRTFIHYKWNIFNFVVAWGAFATTVSSYNLNPYSPFFNINKLFLVSILFFIIPRSNRLSQLLRFASASLPSLLSLVFTWVVVFLVFAIAMNQIFGLTRLGPNTTGNINLRSVPKALILLFRCSFGEGWNYIMEDFTLSSPFCTSNNDLDHNDCGSKQYAYILFIAWNIISMYIFLNMFISLILDSFDYIGHKKSYSELIQREEIRKFKRTWQQFDPEGTGYIKPIELPKLLRSLDGALSFHFYSGSLSIPELCKKWIVRNNPNDPYDITVNFDAIEYTIDQMDIPKIRERRQAYEMFIEEALLTMELNDDPGISFTRILLQLPLYTAFDMSNCFNLIDYLDRRLLIQKVVKRLHTKRVYETIATYVCRWKYKKDRNLGILDTNIAFDSELKRNSYLTNDELLRNREPPTIFVSDEHDTRSRGEYESDDNDRADEKDTELMTDYFVNQNSSRMTKRGSVIYGEHSPTGGVYYPSSPVAKLSKPHFVKSEHPKLFVEIPSLSKRAQNEASTSPYASINVDDEVRISPFLSPQEVDEARSSKNVSLVDISDIEGILEQSSWKDAMGDIRSKENRKK